MNFHESLVTLEIIKRVCCPIIRVQLGHVDLARNRLLLNLVGQRRVGIMTRWLTSNALKVGKLASEVSQSTLMLLQAFLDLSPNMLVS